VPPRWGAIYTSILNGGGSLKTSGNGPKEIGVFANVLIEGSYQRIDLELGKTHDEYEKQINEHSKF
jgi:hypothetical protein